MLIHTHENIDNNNNQGKRGYQFESKGGMKLEEGGLGKTEGRKRKRTVIKLYLI